MTEVKVWVLWILLTALCALFLVVLPILINSVTKRLDKIVETNEVLSSNFTKLGEQIKTLFERDKEHSNRLNNHGERIRKLELNQASCGKLKNKNNGLD